MSNKSRFRGCFYKQYGKSAQALLKSALQHRDHIHRSLTGKLSWKKSLLLTCQILGLLVNTLAADEKYLVLLGTIQRYQLRCNYLRNKKLFLSLLLPFWNVDSSLNIWYKKMTLVDFVFSKLRTLKTYSDKFLKSLVSQDLSTSSMVNVPKYCWNLLRSTLIIFIDHQQGNWIRKNLSYWHAKSWDWILTHWLPMESILFFILTI